MLAASAKDMARGLGLLAPEFGVAALRATAEGEPAADDDSLDSHLHQCEAVILGPGMVNEDNARRMTARVLRRLKVPVVLDAAAITAFANRFGALRQSRAPKILTPHAGEMAKLMGMSKDRVQSSAVEVATRAAHELNSVVILKGADTFVACPDGVYWRHTGGVSGLATAGSGDTLSGLIGALLARGMTPAGAALWGVLAHAKAGATLSRSVGPVGFLARELPDMFPGVLRDLARG